MGNDGGSIPGRQDLVKEKKRKKRYENELTKTSKAKYCSISKEVLKKPIVGCKLGLLYNKEFLIRALLDKKMPKSFRHITSLKDVKELNIMLNEKAADGEELKILCPITMLEFNGYNTFYFIWKCGCVVSKKAVEELNMKENCIVCGEKININTDLINLNMTKEEKENLYNILTSEKLKTKKVTVTKIEDENYLGKKRDYPSKNLETENEIKNMINPLNLSQISTVQK